MSATCDSCGAPLLWAQTATGERVPLDRETSPVGDWTLEPAPFAARRRAALLAGGVLAHARHGGVPLHTKHECEAR